MVNTTMPTLDRRSIAEVEAVTVDQLLAAATTADDQLRLAAEIADKAQALADRLRPQRDLAALSLAFYQPPRGLLARLPGIIGVNRTRLYEIRDAHNPKDVPRDPDAAKKLPRLAARVAAAEERAKAARKVRDQLVADFLHAGRTPVEVADLIGRNRSRVWQVIKKVDA